MAGMLKRRGWRMLMVALAAGALAVLVNLQVYFAGRSGVRALNNAEPAEAALVLGAAVHPDGRPSVILMDRLQTALELRRAGKVRKILVTGDHGRHTYDEVNVMRAWLEARGVPPEDVFCDHAGFDTYDSLRRARDVFACRRLIVVTQAFHLPRALYIAEGLGLEAQGVEADRWIYRDAAWHQMRELGARIKAFACVTFGASPRFLGPVIPISGDGRATRG